MVFVVLHKPSEMKDDYFNNINVMLVTQSCRLFATSWTVAHQTPLSMEFSRQEYWSGLPFPSPGDIPTGLLHCRQILYPLSRQGKHESWLPFTSISCVPPLSWHLTCVPEGCEVR